MTELGLRSKTSSNKERFNSPEVRVELYINPFFFGCVYPKCWIYLPGGQLLSSCVDSLAVGRCDCRCLAASDARGACRAELKGGTKCLFPDCCFLMWEW